MKDQKEEELKLHDSIEEAQKSNTVPIKIERNAENDKSLESYHHKSKDSYLDPGTYQVQATSAKVTQEKGEDDKKATFESERVS